MPRMDIDTLRKSDSELAYVLKPGDENPATNHGVCEPVTQPVAEEQETTSEDLATGTEVTIEDDPCVAHSEEVATSLVTAGAIDEIELMSTEDREGSDSNSSTNDQSNGTKQPCSKGNEVTEQPGIEITLPVQPGGGPVISRAGILTIPQATWLALLPEKNPEGKGQRILKNGWTHVICKAYSVVNPYCVLSFRKSYLGKAQPNFWRANAICKHTDCIQVRFSVSEFPIPGDEIPMHFEVKGTYNHKEGEVRRRQIRGQERVRLLQEYKHLPPSAIKAKLMSCVDKSVLNAGNHSSVPTLQTLHRLTCDGRKKEEKDTDMWRDLEATSEEENSPIRVLSYRPFVLAWHTKEQIQFLNTLEVRQLFVGCTGHFVRELSHLPVYYYALIVRPGGGKPDFPIAEMLTDCERGATVSFWLSGVANDIMEFASLDIRNSRTEVVVDGGEVLRDATSRAFMGSSLKYYLSDCISAGEVGEQVFPSLHVCGVQEIYAAMEAVSKMPHTLEGEQTAFRVITALQKAADLNQAIEIFKWASAVFSARFVTQRVSIAITNLERAISGFHRLDIAPEAHRHTKVVVPDNAKANDPQKSPFYNVFKSLSQLNSINFQDVAQYENALYIPGFIEYLMQSHLAHLPLWWNSAPSSLANCVTEKWFHHVKINVLRGQKNLKPGRFFRIQVDLVAALLKDAQKEQ